MQEKIKIIAIVTEKIVIKCWNFHSLVGGTILIMALANRRTNRSACLEQFLILDSKDIFLKKQHVSGSCSFGEVVHMDADAYTDATE